VERGFRADNLRLTYDEGVLITLRYLDFRLGQAAQQSHPVRNQQTPGLVCPLVSGVGHGRRDKMDR
jgi:hypothetical protein